jgi:hypothetical protein
VSQRLRTVWQLCLPWLLAPLAWSLVVFLIDSTSLTVLVTASLPALRGALTLPLRARVLDLGPGSWARARLPNLKLVREPCGTRSPRFCDCFPRQLGDQRGACACACCACKTGLQRCECTRERFSCVPQPNATSTTILRLCLCTVYGGSRSLQPAHAELKLAML